MSRKKSLWLTAVLVGLLMWVGSGLAGGLAQEDEDDAANSDETAECAPARVEAVTIETARLYIEYNAAAGDVGVHGAFDDHGWSQLCVFDPSGALVLAVEPQAQLGDLGIAGIFFESREPVLEELALDALAARFPEGQYQVVGTNFDGTRLGGAAWFTHNIPAKSVIVAPELAAEAQQAGDVILSASDLVVEWQPVTQTVDGRPVTITGYEVIVTRLRETDPHGFSLPVYDVHVPADRTRLPVPVEFFEPNTGYEIELLALEESGNQTIAGGYFTTG